MPVTLKLDDISCEVRTLTSGDADAEANVFLQEIILHTEWIQRVRERFFVDSPSRRQRLEQAGFEIGALLLQAAVPTESAPALTAQIGRVFEKLLPGAGPDLPEAPNDVVFERLARVLEARRKALAKLLQELCTDTEYKANIEPIVNRIRDDATLNRVLDAVMG